MSGSIFREGKIHTVAGIGAPGFTGDGGPAIAAALNGPAGLAVDKNGNLYIADMLNHAIRRVDAQLGLITTVVGCGKAGFGGDGGPAVNALLNGPEGMAVGLDGSIYIADSSNHRIRRVDGKSGKIETIAGSGKAGYAGDGEDGRRAMLNHPAGVVADSRGCIYFNDYKNDRIRKVDKSGQITTYAGTGEAGYSGDGGPASMARINDVYGLAIDGLDNLYIMDSLNFAVRKVDADTGIITTVIGTGKPGNSPDYVAISAAYLGGEAHVKGDIGGKVPHAVEASRTGNVFIAETGLQRIRMADIRRGEVYTVAGNGEGGLCPSSTKALSACMDVHGIRIDSKGRLYFNDFHSHVVRVLLFPDDAAIS